jgi:addiction module RelE/StbE family toxin
MIDIKINPAFEKKLKKFVSRRPEYKDIICDKIKLLSTNPNARELENHKLSGELKGQRAISISEDYRITFIEVEENVYLLLNIGSHDVVY